MVISRPTIAAVASAEIAALALAGAAVALLGPAQPAEAKPGVPVLTEVAVAGVQVPVLVAPARPGWNLVHVGAEPAAVGTAPDRLVAGQARPGTRHTWAEVWLPAGRGQLWIELAGQLHTLPVDTGPPGGAPAPDLRGPDGPECANVALGGAIAAAPAPLRACPADRLAPADAAAIRAMVRFVAARGVTAISLVADSSLRGTQAAATVAAAARAHRIAVKVPDTDRIPLFVVAGWPDAAAAVRGVSTGRLAAQGTYLAPWLLNEMLLATPAGQLLPLRSDPTGAAAVAYLSTLRSRLPSTPATAASYLGWRGPAGGGEHAVRLYAASPRIVAGAVPAGGHRHDHAAVRWLPDGAITAVTGPLEGT